MKARVKATGEIVEVREEYGFRGKEVQVFYSNEEDPHEVYEKENLFFMGKSKGAMDAYLDVIQLIKSIQDGN